jgi:single-stranded DNA-binding protein
MTLYAMANGTLQGKPQTRTASTGRTYATATVRTPTGKDGAALYISVKVFSDEACAALLVLNDGDAVSCAGTLEVKAYAAKDGQPRPSVDMIANAVQTLADAKRRPAREESLPLQRAQTGSSKYEH